MCEENEMVFPSSLGEFLQMVGTKEWGAPQLILSFARRIGIDRIIFPAAVPWREDVLAMIAGGLIFPLCDISFTSQGQNLDEHCYQPLATLLSRQQIIQTKLAGKHIINGSALLYDLTNSHSLFVGEKLRAGLILNVEGCPFGIEYFPQEPVGGKKHIQALVDRYKLQSLELVGEIRTSDEIAVRTIFRHTTHIEPEYAPRRTEAFLTLPKAANFFGDIAFESGFHHNVVNARLLLGMLTYYVQWHMTVELRNYLKTNQTDRNKHWTLPFVIERLKAIRTQTVRWETGHTGDLINDIDAEQSEIISAFGFTPEDFFLSGFRA